MAELNPLIPLGIGQQGAQFDPVGTFLGTKQAIEEGREKSTLRAEQIENLRSQIDAREATQQAEERAARDDRRARSIIQAGAVVSQLMKEDPTGQKAIDFLEQRIPRLQADPNQDATESLDLLRQLKQGLQAGDQSQANATILSVQALANQLDIPFAVGDAAQEKPKFSAVSEIHPDGSISGLDNQGKPFALAADGTPLEGADKVKALAQSRQVEVAQRGKIRLTEAQITQSIAQGTKAFDQIGPLRKSMGNIDEAIEQVRAGAATGPIISKLPSFRQTAIALDNIQARMGLDIIGNTTFGALSESELAFALATAVPQGLEGDALIQWLENRKAAQIKLLSYYSDAAGALSAGRPVSEFLKDRKELQESVTTTPTTQQFAEGQTATNHQTGEKMVFRNGRWQPAP